MLNEEAFAIGVRAPAGRGRHSAPCVACGRLVNFGDDSTRHVAKKICVECFLDWAETRRGEPFRLVVTPENLALLRALITTPTGEPS